MKFTELYGLCLVLSLMVLSACSTTAKRATDSGTAPTIPSIAPATTEAEAIDPWQHQAQALKALPDRYLSQTPPIVIPEPLSSAVAHGQRLIRQNKLPEAQNYYLSLAEQYAQFSGIWLQLAQLQARQMTAISDQQAQQDAIELQMGYLNAALSANPHNYVAHNQLALLLRQQGHFTQALQHYDLALSSWPAFPQARLNRAILNDLYLGNKKAALEDYQLYQALLEQPERQVKGWIADIKRQIQLQEQDYNRASGSIKGESQ